MKTINEIQDKIERLYDSMDDESPSSIDRQKVDALEWVLGTGDPITGDNDEALGRLATQEEITAAIESLKKERIELPHYSYFRDDNWGGIDGKISLLEWVIKEKT